MQYVYPFVNPIYLLEWTKPHYESYYFVFAFIPTRLDIIGNVLENW